MTLWKFVKGLFAFYYKENKRKGEWVCFDEKEEMNRKLVYYDNGSNVRLRFCLSMDPSAKGQHQEEDGIYVYLHTPRLRKA